MPLAPAAIGIGIATILAAMGVSVSRPWGSTVPIERQYPEKIIYSTERLPEEKEEAIQRHCEQQNGTFIECGSPCAPEVDICLQVCAYICDLSRDTDGETQK